MSNFLLKQIDSNGIAMLTLNRPEVHNVFDDVLIKELIVALKQLDADANVRVVMLTANGKSFSAGADVNWMRRMAGYSQQENQQDAMELALLLKTLKHLTKPTIALVQGAAYGGGVGLIACCDMAIATSQAQFCFSEVKLGLIPAVISPYIFAAIGERHTQYYFLTAEKFAAARALSLNLVQHVVEENELVKVGRQLAENLLNNGPYALAATKQLIAKVVHQPINDVLLKTTAQMIADIRVSPEGQAGLTAFLEKKSPPWVVKKQ